MQDLTTMLVKAQNSASSLWILNHLLDWGAPFNRPHGFDVKMIDERKVEVVAPYKRRNMNHLKGMHACAIATVGELAAGLMLFRYFSSKEYRIILSEMNVEYRRQAKCDVIAKAGLMSSEVDDLSKELQIAGITTKKMVTQVYDDSDQHIATVRTVWQIKDWEKVESTILQ